MCSRGSVLIWAAAGLRGEVELCLHPGLAPPAVTLGNYRDSAVVPRLRAMVTVPPVRLREVLGRSGAQGTVAVPIVILFSSATLGVSRGRETSSPTGRALVCFLLL